MSKAEMNDSAARYRWVARPTHLGVVELELGLERGGLLVKGLLGLLTERLPSDTGGAADLGNILVVRVGQLVLGTGTFAGERFDRKTTNMRARPMRNRFTKTRALEGD